VRVRQQQEAWQLGEAPWRPQRRAEGQPLIERDGVEPIFDHGPNPDQAEPVLDERAQVARVRIGNPDRGEPIVLQEIEQVSGVAAISLGLPNDHGANFGRLADDECMADPVQERVEPQRVPGALDANGDRWSQRRIEALDGIADMGQLLLEVFARLRVEGRPPAAFACADRIRPRS
jgi:hypothetical protein